MKRDLLLLVFFCMSGSAVAQEKPLTFETHIRPLLKAHCVECHGDGAKPKGSLDLRLKRLLLEGGNTGPALVAHKPGESLLIQRVKKGDMPPGKRKLTADEIALIERWIAAGAPTAGPEPKEVPKGFFISGEDRAFWAFQPIKNHEPPKVKNVARVRNPVDAFLLAKLESHHLTYGPEADRRALIRRATFDLLGLPPSPEEVEHFLNDHAPEAYERLIDRLLASPQYGERWGRHWLDVAGYADSEGYTGEDPVRASAWRYRDYVIRSFNANKPWDQFILEQLAGDELTKGPSEKLNPQEVDRLIATGFLRMAPDGTASPGVEQKLASNQNIADTLQIVSTALLGLTVHCAQCHNHRYDPIPQSDYYQLRAIFEPAFNWKNWRTPAGREIALFKEEDRQRADAIEKEATKIDQERIKLLNELIDQTFKKQLAKLPKELVEPVQVARKLPPAQRTPDQQKLLRDYPFVNVDAGSLYLYEPKAAALLKEIDDRAVKLRASKPRPDFIRALTELPGPPPSTFLFDRGDHEQPRQEVGPADLTILDSLNLGKIAAKNQHLPSSGRRLAFARILTGGKHPLPARTLMNRVWLIHFGKGIAGTPGDLGHLGERPTHPELLDWLAAEFMASGWDLKRMHRLMMTSTAYRQASQRREELQKIDPDNRLLGRFSIRRLEAEALRDALLAVGGRLNLKPFGPPVPVTHDEIGQVVVGKDIRNTDGAPLGTVKPLGGEEFRRSIYVQVRRSLPLGILDAFDAPTAAPNCECRHASTVAPQALMLMNSKFIQDQAEQLALRVSREAGLDLRAQAARAWRLAFAAEPTETDLKEAEAFITQQTEHFKAAKRPPQALEPAVQAMTNFCQALLSSNRFLYVD